MSRRLKRVEQNYTGGDEHEVKAEVKSSRLFVSKPSDSGSAEGADEFLHFSLARARQMLYSSVWDTVQKHSTGSVKDTEGFEH